MRPKTKGRTVLLLLACLGCGVFFVTAALSADRQQHREEPPPAAVPAAALAAVTAEVPAGAEAPPLPAYLLREVNGRLCAFRAGEERVPVLMTTISTAHLRAADREALQRGVPADDWEELLLLLEDFGS